MRMDPDFLQRSARPANLLLELRAKTKMEMGIGHPREHRRRERMPLLPAGELTARMAATVLADLPFRSGDEVIAMVNGMGAPR